MEQKKKDPKTNSHTYSHLISDQDVKHTFKK